MLIEYCCKVISSVLIIKIFVVLKIKIQKNKNKKKKMSLILLKTNALNAAFNVAFLVTQKLINIKEVNPIHSQLKNSKTILAELTKNSILKIKVFKNKINLSTNGSYLKYANV